MTDNDLLCLGTLLLRPTRANEPERTSPAFGRIHQRSGARSHGDAGFSLTCPRVDVTGCAAIAQVMHLPTLAKLCEGFEVRAVCDLDDALARAAAATTGFAVTMTNARAVLADERVEAVLILTSGATRRWHSRYCAQESTRSSRSCSVFACADADCLVDERSVRAAGWSTT